MSKLSMDLKVMPRSQKGHKFILCIIDEMMNYLIMVLILTGQGQMWHEYLPLATFAHNTFNSPNLANHSPYELVFGRKPKLLLDLEMNPDVRVKGTHREYLLQLRKRLEYNTIAVT